MKINDIINKIKKNDLALPDFQRGFVWNREKMEKLYASILAHIPVGSVLILKSQDENFYCKKIGAKTNSEPMNISDNGSPKLVSYLIDGQQRYTSLLAGFSTYYFESFKSEKEIASKDLLRLFFVKIPATNNDVSEDPFGARELDFPQQRFFSSSEMYSLIDSKFLFEIISSLNQNKDKGNKEKRKKLFNITDETIFEQIYTYCTSPQPDETGAFFYRIPLQFINGDEKLIAQNRERILDQIGNHHKRDKTDVEKNVWKNSLSKYFTECLSDINLEEIVVENSDKARAIDIYSNLNQGGVILSILDLIVATVGTKDSSNFKQQIIDALDETFKCEKNVLSQEMQTLVAKHKPYSPFHLANVITEDGEMKKMFTSVFLDVLALLVNKKKGKKFSAKSGKDVKSYFTASVTKETEILKLSADDVLSNYRLACLAIARALSFFQTRCGIRKFDDINYKAQVTVVAYFFSDDVYFKNSKIHDLFEYWYWISVFAWMYPSNQKIEILNSIEEFDNFIDSKEKIDNFKYLKKFRTLVLNRNLYSDESTLTMAGVEDTEKYPPKVMTNYICQFYLSRGIGYKSFFIDKKNQKSVQDDINVFYDGRLEIHHINPLGSAPNKKLGVSTKKLRKDPNNPYNSPLNMMFITKSDNGIILDTEYSKYFEIPEVKKILPSLGCNELNQNEGIDVFLKKRFTSLNSSLDGVLKALELSLERGVKNGKKTIKGN